MATHWDQTVNLYAKMVNHVYVAQTVSLVAQTPIHMAWIIKQSIKMEILVLLFLADQMVPQLDQVVNQRLKTANLVKAIQKVSTVAQMAIL